MIGPISVHLPDNARVEISTQRYGASDNHPGNRVLEITAGDRALRESLRIFGSDEQLLSLALAIRLALEPRQGDAA